MKKLTAKLILAGIVFSAQVASGFYDSSLGRWLNRDPLEEPGASLLPVPNEIALLRERWHDIGVMPAQRPDAFVLAKAESIFHTVALSTAERANLYGYVLNDPINNTDSWGLVGLPPGWTGPGRPYNPTCNPFAGPPPPCVVEAIPVATVCPIAVVVCARSGIGSATCQAAAGSCAGAWLILNTCLSSVNK